MFVASQRLVTAVRFFKVDAIICSARQMLAVAQWKHLKFENDPTTSGLDHRAKRKAVWRRGEIWPHGHARRSPRGFCKTVWGRRFNFKQGDEPPFLTHPSSRLEQSRT